MTQIVSDLLTGANLMCSVIAHHAHNKSHAMTLDCLGAINYVVTFQSEPNKVTRDDLEDMFDAIDFLQAMHGDRFVVWGKRDA